MSVSVLEEGFELRENFVGQDCVHAINEETGTHSFPKRAGGIRNAEKKLRSVQQLILSGIFTEKAQGYLSGQANFVRAILFNKSVDVNWLVAWHQDKTVCVSQRFAAPGWGPWSTKDGVLHVQPPVEVLNEMVTFRIHLDDTDEQNGCLKILPGSHREGILSKEQVYRYTHQCTPVYCRAKAGSALVMRPHILHASSKAIGPSPRRVLHVEFSSYTLPEGIDWA